MIGHMIWINRSELNAAKCKTSSEPLACPVSGIHMGMNGIQWNEKCRVTIPWLLKRSQVTRDNSENLRWSSEWLLMMLNGLKIKKLIKTSKLNWCQQPRSWIFLSRCRLRNVLRTLWLVLKALYCNWFYCIFASSL